LTSNAAPGIVETADDIHTSRADVALKPISALILAGLVIAALLPISTSLLAVATEILGSGATFPYPIYQRWADVYQRETGIVVNYYPIGSGEGIKQIQNNVVAFAGSDMPLKLNLLKKAGLIQFPTVIGGIVPIMNLDGIRSGDIRLNGETLAKIFLGEVTVWNDPAIVQLNPKANLPPQRIVIVHRSDDSGTSFVWTNYLSKVSPEWKSKVGENTSVDWPTGVGGNDNDGVINTVQNTEGAIGYVEYAYAKQSKSATVNMINKDGTTVEPTYESFEAAASGVTWDKEDGFYVILTDRPGPASWPITGASFILVHEQPDNPLATGEALKFFSWAYSKGDKIAEDLEYVPLPKNVVGEIEKTWAGQIKDASGKPLFPLTP
jgi:phosphate transport system substrate-binding protein